MSAGADCGTIISGEKESKTFDEFIEWLEPSDERPGAICESAEDFFRLKASLERACQLLKHRCTEEMKANIKMISENVDNLLNDAKLF
jgi:hypothetical protein